MVFERLWRLAALARVILSPNSYSIAKFNASFRSFFANPYSDADKFMAHDYGVSCLALRYDIC